MKSALSHKEASLGPLQRKTFQGALVRELRLHIPTLGELTAEPLARRIGELVEQYFPKTQRLRMGQILWPAVDERESAGYGKRIEQTALKPVLLEAISQQDVQDLLRGLPRREIRKKTAVRLCEQAKAQGGVLTGVDVATMLRISPATVSRYIREVERQGGRLIPRRGTLHDMGPSVSHKRQICRMVILEGCSIEQTARATSHSPEAVTRYVQDYRRVHACLTMGLTVEQTAFTTALSKRLVQEYTDLVNDRGSLKESGRRI
jgi:predicted transcriptional regulator